MILCKSIEKLTGIANQVDLPTSETSAIAFKSLNKYIFDKIIGKLQNLLALLFAVFENPATFSSGSMNAINQLTNFGSDNMN